MPRLSPARVLYAPFLAQMVVTRYCNLDCGYCSEFDKVSKPIPTEELKRRLAKLRQLGTFAAELTGGEPMTHPDIYELIRYAKKDLKFFKVQMISNAYLFNAAKIEKLNEAGLEELQISIDGVKPNDITVKVLKPLRKKLEAVARTAKFKVVLNSVIGSAPPEEVLEVIDFAQEHGFVPRVSFVHDDKGQISLDESGFRLIDQIKERLGRRFFNGGDYRQRLMNAGEAPFRCRAGSRYLYIDEHGTVRWCSQTRDGWGIPLADYSEANLKEQFHTGKSCNTGCTLGCVRHCSRYDQWRPQTGETAEPVSTH
jgi:MoaA/NifB/PqqE/SkfB family radical SAM enzyme